MNTAVSTFINGLDTTTNTAEFDYAGDYFTCWVEGWRRPIVADYAGLTVERAETIRRFIEANQNGRLFGMPAAGLAE